MFGRPLRSRFDLILPDLSSRVAGKQDKIQERRSTLRSFSEGDLVYCKDYFRNKHKWIPGVIQSKSEPLSYKVKLPDGRLFSRHVDQLNSRTESRSQEDFDFPVTAISPPDSRLVTPQDSALPIIATRRSSRVSCPRYVSTPVSREGNVIFEVWNLYLCSLLFCALYVLWCCM